ncbi:UNKNOWN [Stylonychia lemnae]|uniref:Gelsolin-like domain-containing protein n=1 Tax=Stylonychia lemnae TaxID=5949 RepID=A0A078B8T8_STYLE|nr:UNKNOWN [Stylonychia lemnae]|eukprot:CDW90641.1 UNKNOWN [Stylonychia lemnae]
MQRNQIFEHCKDPENEGLSIWQYPNLRKRPLFLTSTLRTIPKFDSNSSYIVIQSKNNYSILNDAPYNSYKIFFWVGSRSQDYQVKFQETVQMLQELEEEVPQTKIRYYIEFQYSESFQFFALFKRQDLNIERTTELSAIAYQDFYKVNILTKFIPFPKLMIFEMIDHPSEYKKFFVRIYEKKELDTKIKSSMIYFFMQGVYVNSKGAIVNPGEATKDEVSERINHIDVLYGSKANYELIQFVKRLLDNYKIQFLDKIEISEVRQKGESLLPLWVEIEEKAIFMNSEVDLSWPCEKEDIESELYPYPYAIQNSWDWNSKSEEEIESTFEDQENVKYNIQNEYNITMKKADIEFDPNQLQLFRLSLSINESRATQYQVQSRATQQLDLDFSDKYIVAFQQIKLKGTDSNMLNSNHSYIIYSPFTLFLWHGADIDLERKKSSLYILKMFLNSKLYEHINYQPSYMDQNQNLSTIKFRVELQYYESQRFKSFFEKTWNDDKLDYQMMAMEKINKANVDNSSEEEYDNEEEKDQFDNFNMLAEQRQQTSSRMLSEINSFEQKQKTSQVRRIQKESINIKERPQTVADIKSFSRNNTLLANERKSEIPVDENLDQEKFNSLVYSFFEPMSILSRYQTQRETQFVSQKFDQIAIFSIQGSKFDLVNADQNETGILDASKTYFIVFSNQNQGYQASIIKDLHAIYLWRGSDQSSMNVVKALTKIQETEFRSLKQNQTATQQASGYSKRMSMDNNNNKILGFSKSASTVHLENDKKFDVSKFDISKDDTLQKQSIKKQNVLTPILNLKFAAKDKINETKVRNLRALVDDDSGAINLRSIIKMDHEPMHFLQAFQGVLIIRTNDYLKKIQSNNDYDPNDDSKSINYVMLFQLIGVPNLNQRAREVPPFYESLTTSGLYIMITSKEVHFWIGQDYFDNYLNDHIYRKQRRLISDVLLKKLITMYNTIHDEILETKRPLIFNIQGQEKKKFMRIINGKNSELSDQEDDEIIDTPYLNFESNFIKKLVLPQEPRLFCLIYNGNIVEYDSERQDDDQLKSLLTERQALIFKEIHSFNQKSLDQKGVFLLDFCSEAFIWTGKKVTDKDRLMVLQLAFQTLCFLHPQGQDQIEKMAISFIENGYEPEIFKKQFKDGWQNFDHTMAGIIESSDEEEDEEKPSLDDTMMINQKISEKGSKIKVELIPESYWIN